MTFQKWGVALLAAAWPSQIKPKSIWSANEYEVDASEKNRLYKVIAFQAFKPNYRFMADLINPTLTLQETSLYFCLFSLAVSDFCTTLFYNNRVELINMRA